jgi:hypothetical protein
MSTYIGRLLKRIFSKKSHLKKKGSSSGNKSDAQRKSYSRKNESSYKVAKTIKQDVIDKQKEAKSKSLLSGSKGIRTQVNDAGYEEEKELVIGFDFGTSCSKIIIQDVVIQTCYAVPFEGIAIDKQGYFVPSHVFISDEGDFRLESSGHSLKDIKIRLMDSPGQQFDKKLSSDLTAVDVTTAFIALVLQRAITWFLDNYQDDYRNTHIIWQLNIGLPSRSYDEKSMCEAFRLVALAGWRTAVLSKGVTADSVKESVRNCHADIHKPDNVTAPALHPECVGIIPEVIAEVIGYARSPLRNEGEHLLIDIGASTFDVSLFTLHSPEGEDRYSIWAAEVELFGCLKLHRRRISMANEIIDIEFMKIDEFLDGMMPLPNIEDYFYKSTPGLANVVHEIRDKVDVPFFKKCKQYIYTVVLNTKNNILPLSPCWKQSLPVFICGGGSYSKEYRKMIEECDMKSFGVARFRVIELPKPEGLNAAGLYTNNYHRMAVAYGLSFSTDDIEEIIPPHIAGEDYY